MIKGDSSHFRMISVLSLAKPTHLICYTRPVVASNEQIFNVVERFKTCLFNFTGPLVRARHRRVNDQVEHFLLLEENWIVFVFLIETRLETGRCFFLRVGC